MIDLLYALLATARSSLRSQRDLALENLALRQQLAILHRKSKRPKLHKPDIQILQEQRVTACASSEPRRRHNR